MVELRVGAAVAELRVGAAVDEGGTLLRVRDRTALEGHQPL